MKKFDYLVFIGRFQPFHCGHLHVIKEALKRTQYVIIIAGSVGGPRNPRNPFTFEEVSQMIHSSLEKDMSERVMITSMRDYTYNNLLWMKKIQESVHRIVSLGNLIGDASPDEAKIGLVGHSKDHTSYYLKLFPQWGSIEVDNYNGLNATYLREMLFESQMYFCMVEEMDKLQKGLILPTPVYNFLLDFLKTQAYEDLLDWYFFVKRYMSQYADMKYPPIFHTVDSVVIQSGHVLMIQRKSNPGKNQWALAGGFLNSNEALETAAIRELKEETKIKVPPKVLKGCIKARKTFDAVHRSTCGRRITKAFLIVLPDALTLPKIKAADDAKDAKWVPLGLLDESVCFEDHYSIIMNMVGLAD